MRRPPSARYRVALWLAAIAALAVPVSAEIVVHEWIPENGEEDARMKARTADGTMAAAIETPSGAVLAPDLRTPPRSLGVYGETAAFDNVFHIDPDTAQPASISYEDPFTPSIMPFKREYAFDALNEALGLFVFDPVLKRMDVDGLARPEDDQFFADMWVDLREREPVRIPTVGPSARVIAAKLNAPVQFELLHDGADNWFIRAPTTRRVRLTMHLAVDRGVFGSDYVDSDWKALAAYLPPKPLGDSVKRAAFDVASEVGITSTMSPAPTVRAMVDYFRSFAPSPERLKSQGLELYRELALSQKGVCRHRAYTFVVTALALGIPARLVHNDAHAWVEVRDAVRWHRIDLGGAAGRLDVDVDGRPAHLTPPDPYSWPRGGTSAREVADRARESSASGPPRSGSPRGGGGGAAPPPGSPSQPSTETSDEASDAPTQIEVKLAASTVRRRASVPLSGRVTSNGEPCPEVLVRFSLEPGPTALGLGTIQLGFLFTNDEGWYEGGLPIGPDVSVGDYTLVATTRGGGGCGAGRSR